MIRTILQNVLLGLLFLWWVPAQASIHHIDLDLTPQEKSFIRISATAAQGNLEALAQEINTGLDAGLTINQIKENLIHLYAYAGFPRSLRGLQTMMAVLGEREAAGKYDVIGAAETPINDDDTKYNRGKAILEQLTGVSQDGPKTGYAQFAPTIEIFLKEHLFADIFERDILSHAQRELITISILASLGGVEPMLKSHLVICLHMGYTKQQLDEFVTIIGQLAGHEARNSVEAIVEEVLVYK